MIGVDIALRLVELRKKLGMSRTSFAKSIGITETHMKRFETGVAVPKEKHINTICEKYHVKPEYFTGEVSIEEAITEVDDDGREDTGKRLKEIRLERGMTIKEFSSLINISYTHLYMVETGNNPLSEKMASEIADRLHLGIDWLLYGNERAKDWPLDTEMVVSTITQFSALLVIQFSSLISIKKQPFRLFCEL